MFRFRREPRAQLSGIVPAMCCQNQPVNRNGNDQGSKTPFFRPSFARIAFAFYRVCDVSNEIPAIRIPATEVARMKQTVGQANGQGQT